MKVTVLGCGSSVGTPAAGGYWGVCDPKNPKNHRSRASLLVSSATTDILIDATYDLRQQLNAIEQSKIDAVFLSHAHSDHICGIDDLRVISYHRGSPIPLYSNAATLEEFGGHFGYTFTGGYGGVYRPFLEKKTVAEDEKLTVGDIPLRLFPQDHGSCTSLGFRVNDFAYSVDVRDFSDAALETLYGIDTWIIDCAGWRREHSATHARLEQIEDWIEKLKPRITYLTVLTNFMDYDALCKELPDHIRPAYDGLVIEI